MGLNRLRDGNIGINDFRHGIQVYSPQGKFVRLHAGLWRDEFDVEHVRMYSITEPRGTT